MIRIMTKLADGIYKSQGGGETKEHYHWDKTSGRNLLTATKKLMEHKAEMAKSFGNIGCGSSWIEIDGKKIDSFELTSIIEHDGAEEREMFGSLSHRFEDFIKTI